MVRYLRTTEGGEFAEDCNVLAGHDTICANEVAVRVRCPGRKLKIDKMGAWTFNGQLTTLAALATTSRSLGTADIVAPIEAMSEGEIRAMSRRHSVASERNMARVMSRELLDGSLS